MKEKAKELDFSFLLVAHISAPRHPPRLEREFKTELSLLIHLFQKNVVGDNGGCTTEMNCGYHWVCKISKMVPTVHFGRATSSPTTFFEICVYSHRI